MRVCLGDPIRSSVPLLVLLTLGAAPALSQIITTVAGTDWVFSGDGRQALNAPLGKVQGLASDPAGNLYVADPDNHMIFRIAPNGVLTVLAGNGLSGLSGDGGAATSARLSVPASIARDTAGNLYFTDADRIRKIAPDGTVSLFAGGKGYGYSGDGAAATSAKIYPNFLPGNLAVDSQGYVYLADLGNYRVRRIGPDGIIRTIAGTGVAGDSGDGGPATSATVTPAGLTLDAQGNLYILDGAQWVIRKVDRNGVITTVAGLRAGASPAQSPEGTAQLQARLGGFAGGIFVDAAGAIYYTDRAYSKVRKIADGVVRTVAGSGTDGGFAGDGGPATSALLKSPAGVLVGSDGALYIADKANMRIRRVLGGVINTIGGNGLWRYIADGSPAVSAPINGPRGLGIDPSGNVVVAEYDGHFVRRFALNGAIYRVAGTGQDTLGGNGPALQTPLYQPEAIAVDSNGTIYLAGMNGWLARIRDGMFTRLGDLVSTPSVFPDPWLYNPKLAVDPITGVLYIGQGSYQLPTGAQVSARIWKLVDGTPVIVAGTGTKQSTGDGGPASQASLTDVGGLAFDSYGTLYFTDLTRIRKISREGTISTVAGGDLAGFSGDGGPATAARLGPAYGLTFTRTGDLVFCDVGSVRIRKISSTGTMSTIAGNGSPGFAGDGGNPLNAQFFNAREIAADAQGTIFISDNGNGRVRAILTRGGALSSSKSTLSFTSQLNGSAPPQTVLLSSGVPGLPVTVSTNASWMFTNLSNGITPVNLEVSVMPSKAGVGTHTGKILVQAPQASPPSLEITVTFTVTNLPEITPPEPRAGSGALNFSAQRGGGAVSQSLTIWNAGGGSFEFTASPGTRWLSTDPSSGQVTSGAPVTLTVTANPGAQPAGTYTTELRISTLMKEIVVPVTMTVSEPKTRILLSQAGLFFNAVKGGGVSAPQTVAVLNEGQGSMSFTASASTLSGGDWLQVSPASGSVARPLLDAAQIQVSVNHDGLSSGEYYGQIRIASAADNSPQTVTVLLKVLPAGYNPGPEVRPNNLVFTGIHGVDPGSQSITITNLRGQPVSFVSSRLTLDEGTWLFHAPMASRIAVNESARVVVELNYYHLPVGIRRGVITFLFDDGSMRTVGLLSAMAPGTAAVKDGVVFAAACSSPNLRVEFTNLSDGFTAAVGQPTTVEVKVVDDCGNPLVPKSTAATAVLARFSTGEPDLRLVHTGNGVWSGTWKPVSTSNSALVALTALYIEGATRQAGQAQRTGAVASSDSPLLAAGSVVHAASFAQSKPLAPGGLVSVFGANLATGTAAAQTLPLPAELDGTEVLVGGRSLPLLFSSAGQVNAQVPYDLPANTIHQVTVRRGSKVSVPEQLTVAPAQPGIFTRNQQGTGQAAILKSDNITLADSTHPALRGEVVVIYCTGLGAVNPPVEQGQAAPFSPPAQTVATPEVTIGGKPAVVQYSGLTGGFAGLYQVNAVVPLDSATGDDVPVTITVSGQTSRTVTMAVR